MTVTRAIILSWPAGSAYSDTLPAADLTDAGLVLVQNIQDDPVWIQVTLDGTSWHWLYAGGQIVELGPGQATLITAPTWAGLRLYRTTGSIAQASTVPIAVKGDVADVDTGVQIPPEPMHLRPALQVEVWEAPRAAIGTHVSSRDSARLAICRDIVAVEADRRLREADVITIHIAATDPALSAIAEQRLIRTQRAGGGDPEMWRVTKVQRRHAGGAVSVEVEAVALWADLARTGLVADELDGATFLAFARVNQSPTAAMTMALEAYDGGVHFEIGTVDLGRQIGLLSVDHDSPLSLLRKIETAIEGHLRMEWDGDLGSRGGYRIHLEDATLDAPWTGAEVRVGKNELSLSETEAQNEAATRFYGRGNGVTLADAEWTVQAVSGNDLTLVGADGRGPIPDDGWLVGYSIRKVGETTGFLIEATSGSLDTPGILTTPSVSGIAVGDRVEFLDPSGARAAYIDHPSEVAVHGPILRIITAEDIGPIDNLIQNADLSDWNGGLPTGWTSKGNPVISQVDTGLEPHEVEFGTYAAKADAVAKGDGLVSSAFLWSKTARQSVLSTMASLIVWSGKVGVRVVDVANGTAYPLGEVAYAEHGGGPDPERFAVTINDVDIPSGEYQVEITALTDDASWAVDALTSAGAQALDGIVVGSGPQDLWRRVASEAIWAYTPKRTYRVDLVNLYRLDPERFAHESIEVGRAIRVFDERLDIGVQAKVVSLRERLDTLEAEGSVELSTARRDIKDLLGGQSLQYRPGGERARRVPASLPRPRIEIVEHPGNADVAVSLAFRVYLPDETELTNTDPAVAPTVTLESTGGDIGLEYSNGAWRLTENPVPRAQGDYLTITVPGTSTYGAVSQPVSLNGAPDNLIIQLDAQNQTSKFPTYAGDTAQVRFGVFRRLVADPASLLGAFGWDAAWNPTARLKSTGAAVAITGSQVGAWPASHWIWETDEFLADPQGDILTITMPAREGEWRGASVDVTIPPTPRMLERHASYDASQSPGNRATAMAEATETYHLRIEGTTDATGVLAVDLSEFGLQYDAAKWVAMYANAPASQVAVDELAFEAVNNEMTMTFTDHLGADLASTSVTAYVMVAIKP